MSHLKQGDKPNRKLLLAGVLSVEPEQLTRFRVIQSGTGGIPPIKT